MDDAKRTRCYADYYFRSAQRWSIFYWAAQTTLSILSVATGVMLATDLMQEYVVAKYAFSAVTVIVGIAVPFLGRVNAGSRADVAERAGNEFAKLSFRYARLPTDELDDKYMQLIDEYDEPDAEYIKRQMEN